jgi:hypothetical protein
MLDVGIVSLTEMKRGQMNQRLRPTHRWYGAGTYLWLGKLGMWFGVDAERWGRLGVSPIWCEFSSDENFGKARIVRERLGTFPYRNAHTTMGVRL